MNKLSPRLNVVASFIEDNSKVIDIGCDHGFLSIYLANKYKNIKIIASDVNENALRSATINIKKAHLDERIETRLGSGLSVVSPIEIDTIVIAGMGSNTIVGILKYSRDKLINVKNIIVQSNTDLLFLRKNITRIGYYIEDEELVLDNGIIYTVIKFTKGRRKYSYRNLYLGPVLLKKNDELFRKKTDKELKTLRMILNNIKSGHYFYRMKIKRNIRLLENLKCS